MRAAIRRSSTEPQAPWSCSISRCVPAAPRHWQDCGPWSRPHSDPTDRSDRNCSNHNGCDNGSIGARFRGVNRNWCRDRTRPGQEEARADLQAGRSLFATYPRHRRACGAATSHAEPDKYPWLTQLLARPRPLESAALSRRAHPQQTFGLRHAPPLLLGVSNEGRERWCRSFRDATRNESRSGRTGRFRWSMHLSAIMTIAGAAAPVAVHGGAPIATCISASAG